MDFSYIVKQEHEAQERKICEGKTLGVVHIEMVIKIREVAKDFLGVPIEYKENALPRNEKRSIKGPGSD